MTDYRRADSVQFRVRKHRLINKYNCIANIWGKEIAENIIRADLAK